MNLTILKSIMINCVLVDISINSMEQSPWESDQLICSSLLLFYGYHVEQIETKSGYTWASGKLHSSLMMDLAKKILKFKQ
jgi:hypothetical protein